VRALAAATANRGLAAEHRALPRRLHRCAAPRDRRFIAPWRARVLIVDDDPDIRALVMYRLTASGYEVICADDGAAGLAAAREHAPDLVLVTG
jgi:PleD family two-component response regulator